MTANTIGMDTFFVPLNKLDTSDANVRRTGRDEGIEELASLIASQGLLQALGVTAKLDEEGQPTGRYAVNFGGRRFAALKLLAKRKTIAKAAPISCRLVSEDQAAEASLAENSGRVAMHPADQAEAFAALHGGERGIAVEQIALRFGVSVHTVKQRLRLAAVSPVLIEHFREGTLTLEQVSAFAVVDDHVAQEQVFHQLPEYALTSHNIRRQLTQAEVSATDRRAGFVGAEAYEAAGGIIRRDLFTDDAGGWFTDPLLLDRLVVEKLALEADAIRAEGWAWVEAVSSLPPEFHHLRRVYPEIVPLSEEDAIRLSELGERFDEMAAVGDELTEEQDTALAAIEAEMDAIQAGEEVFSPEDITRAGAFVTLGHQGVSVVRGILRADAPEAPQAQGEDGETPQAFPTSANVVQGPKGQTLSATLVAELAAHRTAGLQAEIAMRPHLALCLLVEAMVSRCSTTCNVHVTEPALHAACPGIEESDARQQLGHEEAPAGWRVPGGAALLPWLIEQDTDTLLQILAPMIARGLDARADDWTAEGGSHLPAAQVAQIAGLDMRLWWKPTAANYLGRVSKSLILDAVREGAGESAARQLDGLKKAPMAEAAAELLDGKGWLPAMLRTPPLAQTEELEIAPAPELAQAAE